MPSPMSPVQDAFRDLMAHVAAPVAVVTATHDGVPYGTTISAFTSLSMTPPLILACLERSSRTLQIVSSTQRFGINILASMQPGIALAFSRKGGPEKFRDIAWQPDRELPRIEGVAGWVACRLHQLVDGGDHLIMLGDVETAERLSTDPLVYHRRVFGTHQALEHS